MKIVWLPLYFKPERSTSRPESRDDRRQGRRARLNDTTPDALFDKLVGAPRPSPMAQQRGVAGSTLSISQLSVYGERMSQPMSTKYTTLKKYPTSFVSFRFVTTRMKT